MSKPSSKGLLAKHPRGFVLVVPWHIAHCREPCRPLILGCIKVLGDANKSLRLAGDVPGTWLVDLNSAPVTVEDAE